MEQFTTLEKARVLKNHSIEYKIEGSQLHALDVIYNANTGATESNWVDITDWNKQQLANWLGY